MKKLLFLVTLWLGVLQGMLAQGVSFRETIDWEQAIAESRSTGKMIFIDFYTSWCGPCKRLATTIFPQKQVGEFFNAHFLCYKLDAEKQGKALAQKYKVASYPTLLFISPEGELVHRIGFETEEGLLKAGKKALEMAETSGGLTAMKAQYAAGKKDEAFLKTYMKVLGDAHELSCKEVEDYLAVQKSMPENSLEMMNFLMQNSNYTVLGGQAERIWKENLDTYLSSDISRMKKEIVKMAMGRMADATRRTALQDRDGELYKKFLDYKLGEGKTDEQLQEYRMELLLLEGKKEQYVPMMAAYIDRIVQSNPVEEVKAKDAKAYKVTRSNPKRKETALDVHRVGAPLIKDIVRLGSNLLAVVDFGNMDMFGPWITYGKAIYPDYYVVLNFEANVLYKQGRKQEAVRVKQEAWEHTPSHMKAHTWIKDELASMQKGDFLGGRIITN